MSNVSKTIAYLKRNGIVNTVYAVTERLKEKQGVPYIYAQTSEEILADQRALSRNSKLLLSIVVPVYETNPVFLQELIDSCLAQTYDNFELVLADASNSDSCEQVIAKYDDGRVVYFRLNKNEGISENTNRAIEKAAGDYIIFADHDDLLAPDALYEIALAIMVKGVKHGKKPVMVYTDEDKCDANANTFFEPNCKADFNLDMLMSNNYICHITAVKADIVKELMLRGDYNGSQDYDFILRVVGRIMDAGERPEDCIYHVPKVLYHWRCHELSTASNPASKDYAYNAGLNALKTFVNDRLSKSGKNLGDECFTHLKHRGFYRVEFGCDIFECRKDLAAIGGYVTRGNKITGGVYDDDGRYAGIISNRHYSGPNHVGALTRDVKCLDLRELVPNPVFSDLYADCMALYDSKVQTALNAGEKVDKNKLMVECSLLFAGEVRAKGYRLLLDPQFDKSKYADTLNISGKDTVCVIIPNYNGKDYLKACLDSVKESSHKPLEIIVIDNGSSDGSVQFIRECYPEVKLLANEVNIGFTGAVNQGIRASRGEYVYLLNNDTTMEYDCIEKLVGAIKSDERIFSAGALMLSMDNPMIVDNAGDSINLLGYPRSFANGKSKINIYKDGIAPVFSACAGACLYRKSLFAKIGLFDDMHFAYFEDVDIGYRARIYGYKNVNVRNAVVYHKGSASSGSKHNAFKVSLSSKNSILVPRKNMPLIQFVINFPFLLLGYLIKFAFFTLKGLGLVYLKGVLKGLRLSYSEEGRSHKVKFRWKHLWNYFCIQMWIFNIN